MTTARTRRPRCFLVYAIAPDGLGAAEANQLFNEFVADPQLPLVLFHDHFIGQPGGVAIFYIASTEERDSLLENGHLGDWRVELQPMIFSRSPSAFDEQIAFTLNAYRGEDWEVIKNEDRPSYGDPRKEAETATEEED